MTFVVNPTEAQNTDFIILTDERYITNAFQFATDKNYILMPYNLYSMFTKLYKALPIGPNVQLIKQDQHFNVNGHEIFYENNQLVIDAQVAHVFDLPDQSQFITQQIIQSAYQPTTLTLNTISELLFALSQCARIKYDVDNGRSSMQTLETLKINPVDKSLYKLRCAEFTQVFPFLKPDIQQQYQNKDNLQVVTEGDFHVSIQIVKSQYSFSTLYSQNGGCDRSKLKDFLLKNDEDDRRRPNTFQNGLIGDEFDIGGEFDVIDIEGGAEDEGDVW